MVERRYPNPRRFACVAALTLLMLPFQNCSVPARSRGAGDVEGRQTAGGGTDGKLSRNYVSYGACADGVRVRSSITMADDFRSARLLVADCQPLAQPRVLSAQDFRFLAADNSLLLYQDRIFDRQLALGTQKVTLQVCQASGDPAVQARVWATLGQPGAFMAELTVGARKSGAILLQAPRGTRYLSEVGQAESFDLNVNGTTASLSYALGGQSPQTRDGLACLSQATPPVDDGAGGAPAGAAPHASLLAGYAVRPAWKVAGVDYAVGVPAGLTLKDPAKISMPGVSVDKTNRLIRVTGNGVTLDGYDFAAGGYGVYVIGAKNTAVLNSNFLGAGVHGDVNADGLTVRNCVFDDSGNPGSFGLILMQGTGALDVQYSWFKNFSRAIVDARSPVVRVQYNLFEGGGAVGGGGFNYLYFTGTATYAPIKVLFNTVTQARYAGSAASTGFVLDGLDGSAVTAEFGYNTLVTAPGAIKTLVEAHTPDTITAAILHDNFVDGRGAGKIFGDDPTAGDANFYSNNFDLNSGDALPEP